MWGPVQREAAAAAKAAEAKGPQTQPSAPAYGQAHGLPMQHGQGGGGALHLGAATAGILGMLAGAASAVVGPVLRGGGGGMGGGRGRGRRR
jgi:hypothetical protein